METAPPTSYSWTKVRWVVLHAFSKSQNYHLPLITDMKFELFGRPKKKIKCSKGSVNNVTNFGFFHINDHISIGLISKHALKRFAHLKSVGIKC